MDPDDDTVNTLQRTLAEVRGFLELGMPADAWLVLEQLPCDTRMDSEMIGARLLVLAKLKKWELGADMVNLISREHPVAPRAAAGAYLLAHAAEMCLCGQT